MGILDAPSAPRPQKGLLANRPNAVGSMRSYFATDDGGGCLHLDVGNGTWRRMHPRGEINRTVMVSGPGNITSTGLTDLRGMFVPFYSDGVRPIEVVAYMPSIEIQTAGEEARLAIVEVGVSGTIANTYFKGGVNTAHSSMLARTGPIHPTAGLHRYKLQMSTSNATSYIKPVISGGTSISYGFIAVVEL